MSGAGMRARIPRSDDPLGFGLRSVPEPLQRLWLCRQGNPFLEDDVKESRLRLGLPPVGFQEASQYIDWTATRRKRHGHDDSLAPFYLILDGVTLRDAESLVRFHHRDNQMPELLSAPAPCCDSDPLLNEARLLANKYGIEEAAGEPGFEAVVEDVAGYVLKPAWPPRKSFRGHEVIYETDVVIDSSTGQRYRENYLKKELGLESRGGAGGMLPVHNEWWKQRRAGRDCFDIGEANEQEFGPDANYDDRSIYLGIKEVERLMAPLKN